VQRRSWAIWANVGVQVLLIAGWVVYPGVGFIGLLFTVVWLLLVYLRAEVLRRQKRGLLPGQQPSSG
jgi:multisubunit Na+/H+ antiporter MnhB subunit